ncbi:hypothetical protein GNI_106570 [Gregarina niphandrodes]|uniref:GLE1-like protein n=1 Tax=Gregarina niphandrodes TaxID=110365 RepID=A0A023B3T8_GRENI|nr:hypothetical protein GNI_106570 [Gregarina niphandrodes]EZG55997.1 hypothetical protein GNI_106570 [Gregarina niphandrodes]|eukprot:XP_011131385.1 hypothetical protein GNI_106570 [Gregarina niphandrodes]
MRKALGIPDSILTNFSKGLFREDVHNGWRWGHAVNGRSMAARIDGGWEAPVLELAKTVPCPDLEYEEDYPVVEHVLLGRINSFITQLKTAEEKLAQELAEKKRKTEAAREEARKQEAKEAEETKKVEAEKKQAVRAVIEQNRLSKTGEIDKTGEPADNAGKIGEAGKAGETGKADLAGFPGEVGRAGGADDLKSGLHKPEAQPPGSVTGRERGVCLSSEDKEEVLRVKRMDYVVSSAEYKACLEVEEVLLKVAKDAESLPKKLARTMQSMVDQKTALENSVQTVMQRGRQLDVENPKCEGLKKLLTALPADDLPRECDSFTFAFVNELLRNLLDAYKSQAHQAHTVWSFSHFVALLLRSRMQEIVHPLWLYNCRSRSLGCIPVWDADHTGPNQHVLRLYTATLVCVPDHKSLWSYIAAVVNDMSHGLAAHSALHILNAVVGVAHGSMTNTFKNQYAKIVRILEHDVVPKLTISLVDSDARVQAEQLLHTLKDTSGKMPDAYVLPPREKELTID